MRRFAIFSVSIDLFSFGRFWVEDDVSARKIMSRLLLSYTADWYDQPM